MLFGVGNQVDGDQAALCTIRRARWRAAGGELPATPPEWRSQAQDRLIWESLSKPYRKLDLAPVERFNATESVPSREPDTEQPEV